jgi:hypothetical protein
MKYTVYKKGKKAVIYLAVVSQLWLLIMLFLIFKSNTDNISIFIPILLFTELFDIFYLYLSRFHAGTVVLDEKSVKCLIV